jgi:small subunit ribosomal protein S8
MTDPIADIIAQIKNGYLASKKKVTVPYSKMKEALAKVLAQEGYLGNIKIEGKEKIKKTLVLDLVYDGKKGKLTDIKMVSKPGRRVYAAKDKIGKVLGGLGVIIISTPLGLLSDRQAKKKGVGGEVICKLW